MLSPFLPPLFDRLQLIFDDAWPGALNMAIDQVLLETTTEPVLRIYDWEQPTISFGYRHDFTERNDDLPVVRRWTGGGIVRHQQDATYAIIVPHGHPWARTRPLDSYHSLHHALAMCLNQSGDEPCRLATEADCKPGTLCFDAPAMFDVLRGDTKIAGAGQRRSRAGLLHQGSVARQLPREFWQSYAQMLATEVLVFEEQERKVLRLALELVRVRYGTESWLRSRRDEALAWA